MVGHRSRPGAPDWFGPPLRRWFGRRYFSPEGGPGAGWDRPPFGPFRRGAWGWGRPDPRPERLFDRGDLKYVILDLLREQPRHGYDIIRALEERSSGLYSPSPGSVYPTLQLLEDQGHVTSDQREGKKVYAITDAGRRFLDERAETLTGIRARMAAGMGARGGAEIHALRTEMHALMQSVFGLWRSGALADPERVRRLQQVIAGARREIDAIAAGERAGPATEL
jgi:DNA-binding PadR family transcriptional regulator